MRSFIHISHYMNTRIYTYIYASLRTCVYHIAFKRINLFTNICLLISCCIFRYIYFVYIKIIYIFVMSSNNNNLKIKNHGNRFRSKISKTKS